MRVLITSGGTSEYIDDVRVLTNISTGKLGATIAERFQSSSESIYYIHGKNAVLPWDFNKNRQLIQISGTKELLELMKNLVPQVDVVIHAMAVSDFGFKRDEQVKLKSNDPQAFIDYMRDNIAVNPKIISHIKEWNPDVFLVGFKFEVGKNRDELIDIAYDSLLKNKCDLVVANDKIEMKKEKNHIAYIIDQDKKWIKVSGKNEIAEKLLFRIIDYVEKTTNRKRALKICSPLAKHFSGKKLMTFHDTTDFLIAIEDALYEAERRGRKS